MSIEKIKKEQNNNSWIRGKTEAASLCVSGAFSSSQLKTGTGEMLRATLEQVGRTPGSILQTNTPRKSWTRKSEIFGVTFTLHSCCEKYTFNNLVFILKKKKKEKRTTRGGDFSSLLDKLNIL